MIILSLIFLAVSFFTLWIRQDPKIWGPLLLLSLLSSSLAGNIQIIGLVIILVLALLWFVYKQKHFFALFILLVIYSTLIKMHFLPGFTPAFITPKFAVNLEKSLIGLFPLALLVPLARTLKDWKQVSKGLLIGCMGIGIMAIAATITGATHWKMKLPSDYALRLLINLIFTCIAEEGFFRGFVQNTLCQYFQKIKWGNSLSLFLTSVLFTFTHIFWAPNVSILLFVFIASLLYGFVYLVSKRIESAIFTHFLLNFIHMTFFSYHAM